MRRRHLIHAAAAILTIGCSAGAGTAGVLPLPSTVTTYDVGANPRSIAIADFDADGRRDVVVANTGDGTLQLFFGMAGGQLRPPAPAIPAGNEPSDVDALDVDNDGDVDLVVANHETSRIALLLNTGQGTFTAASGSPFESGARPHVHGVATGDFDGDGWKDVAVESSGTNEVRVFRGGSTGFSNAVGVAVGTMPYFRLGAADLNGDGRVDILVPGHGNNSVRVIQEGRKLLTTSEWTIQLSAQPWMVVGDDVNGDRLTDIIVVVTDGVAVLLRQLQGFTPAVGSPFAVAGATEVATGDMDGDGIADIAVGPWDGSEVTILTGRTFVRRAVQACARPIGLAFADLDGDDRDELAVACAAQNRLAVVRLRAEP